MPTRGMTFDLRAKTTSLTNGLSKASRGFGQLKTSAKGADMAMEKTKSGSASFVASLSKVSTSAMKLSTKILTLNQHVLGLQAVFSAFKSGSAIAKEFATYEDGMLGIKAINRATEKEMIFFKNLVNDLAFNTDFGVKDIQGAIYALSSLGVKGEDAFRSLVPSVVNAATAMDVDLKTAAETVLQTITVYNKPLSEVAKTVDMLAASYTNSSLDLQKFAIASQYASFTSKTLGVSLEETLAVLMALSDQGLDASMVGVKVRAAFTNLTSPTAEARKALQDMGLSLDEVSAETHGYIKVLEKLQSAQMTNAQSETIFGKQNYAAVQALIKIEKFGKVGTEVLKVYKSAVEETGIAAEITKTRQESLGFGIRQIGSSFGILTNSLGEGISKFFNLKEATKGFANYLGETAKLIQGMDFEKLRQDFGNFFKPGDIIKNLSVAFGRFAPTAMDTMTKIFVFSTAKVVTTLANSLPSLMVLSGQLLVSGVIQAGKTFSNLMISALGGLQKLFKKILSELYDVIGQSLMALGAEKSGEALVYRSQQLRINTQTPKYLRDLQELSNSGFNFLQEGVNSAASQDGLITGAARDMIEAVTSSVMDSLAESGYSMQGILSPSAKRNYYTPQNAAGALNNSTSEASAKKAVSQIINDNRVQTFYRAPSRINQLVK